MRSKWKRIFASVLAVIMLIVICVPDRLYAAEESEYPWEWIGNENYGCVRYENLTYAFYEGRRAFEVSWYEGYSNNLMEHVVIPSNIYGYSVFRIGYHAFENCTNVKSIVIPNSVTEINNLAFEGCTGLSSVIVPPSVTKIYGSPFRDCVNLQTIYYPDNVIPESAILTDNTNISYTINEDNTVSLTVRSVNWSDHKTIRVSAPETLLGLPVSSITADASSLMPAENLTCDRHKPDQWYYDENKHWFTKCSVCGNEVKGEAHTYEASNPNNACDCGYIPFTYTPSQQDCTTEYGNTAGTTLSVAVKPTLGNENITYQWYENDAAIAGANQASYTVPAGKKVGAYTYYCKMSCGGYEVTGEKSTVTVVKKKITVTADSKKKYAGEANPALTYTVPAGALAAGDTTTDWQAVLATTATQNSPAGTYPITGTITASQYDITVTPGTLTVEAKKTDDTSSTGQSGGNGSDTETYVNPDKVTPKKGQCFKKGNAVYKVTKTGKNATVTFLRPIKKKTSLSIPATVKAGKVTYKVTAVAKYACKKNTKLKKLTIGKNVTSIGKQAFYGCKNLKSITVKTTKLSKKKVGRQVFKGISKQAVVKMPKKKFGPYKVVFRAADVPKTSRYIAQK